MIFENWFRQGALFMQKSPPQEGGTRGRRIGWYFFFYRFVILFEGFFTAVVPSLGVAGAFKGTFLRGSLEASKRGTAVGALLGVVSRGVTRRHEPSFGVTRRCQEVSQSITRCH